ncbi:hypothetical protein L21_2011 [Methanoculleus chikugoensis]|jgi:hypothetical protein|uniref:Uncharacterized protein n=1 Tax=Methanoculleus chikugoensis TaxID=118126 RepID=A0A1M4MMN7_9EURY|nr:hypothetical protein [Methanoculleus chikugoensis]NMA10278.1 hypothetical protein [Methanomicrobiales archaeon]SCL76090.1 hypothetical protein L21_2011 [Methanoculleus chikugoensis]
MTKTPAWLEMPGVVLIILLAGLTAATVSNLGGREVAVYLMAVLAVASGVVVYFDATAIGAGTRAKTERLRDIETWKPASWAIWVVIFWPFFLPYYLWKRNMVTNP